MYINLICLFVLCLNMYLFIYRHAIHWMNILWYGTLIYSFILHVIALICTLCFLTNLLMQVFFIGCND